MSDGLTFDPFDAGPDAATVDVEERSLDSEAVVQDDEAVAQDEVVTSDELLEEGIEGYGE